MGTSQDYAVAVEEGATIVRRHVCTTGLAWRGDHVRRRGASRSSPAAQARAFAGAGLHEQFAACRESAATGERPHDMAFRDTWHRTLVYFGLAEDATTTTTTTSRRPEPEAELEDRYRERPERAPPAVLAPPARRDRRHLRRRAAASERRTTVLRPVGAAVRGRATRGERAACTSSIPKSFNDAQDVADKFKDAIPVILNLQGADTDLSKRLIDFASGLTYALDGGMQRIADKVFLLTPRNVEVSAEERARLIEKGFFNQS